MILTGYGSFTFAPNFTASLPSTFAGMPSIEPSILERPGHFATFGPVTFREMTIPVEFIAVEGVYASYELAYRDLFKRLDPFRQVPQQLRAQYNDATNVATLALVRVFGFSAFDEDDVNTRRVEFVACEPWTAITVTSTTGTF